MTNKTPPTPPMPAPLSDEELMAALVRCIPTHHDGRRVTKFNLAMDEPFFVHHVGGKPTRPDELWTVRSDASFFFVEGFGKVAAMAWQVRSLMRDYTPKSKVRRRFEGHSAMAEVMAACLALEEALSHGARHAILQTDSQNVVKYLADVWRTAESSYAKSHRNRLEEHAERFDSLQIMWVRTKPTLKDVDALARNVAKAEKKRLIDSWEGYCAELDKKMKQPIQRAHANGLAFYDGYPASANPPLCTCYCWQKSTFPALANNPRGRPRRVCKHLAAAFADAGLTGAQMADFVRDYYLAIRKRVAPPPFPVQAELPVAPVIIVTTPEPGGTS